MTEQDKINNDATMKLLKSVIACINDNIDKIDSKEAEMWEVYPNFVSNLLANLVFNPILNYAKHHGDLSEVPKKYNDLLSSVYTNAKETFDETFLELNKLH